MRRDFAFTFLDLKQISIPLSTLLNGYPRVWKTH